MTSYHADSPGVSRFSVVNHHDYSPDQDDEQHLDAVAQALLDDEPALNAAEVFGDAVQSGVSNGPALFINNSYDIPLLESETISSLEYRLSLLAHDGDILVLRGRRDQVFEQYRNHYLKLGSLDVLDLPGCLPGKPLDLAAHSTQLATICNHVQAAAHQQGCLNLVPFIGMGSVWLLAAEIAAQTGIAVHVAAPPPRLTRRVNDKIWFANRVRQVLGDQAIPPTRTAYGPAALTGLVRSFAKKYPHVIVKVPDSAGSVGNVKLDSEAVQRQSATDTRLVILKLLRHRGWQNSFPLMVEVWDTEVLSSPSVQVWVPLPEEGQPVIEGIFDQIVSDSNQSFIGATIARLAPAWEQRLVVESARLAGLMQRLGYYGRLSFDTVIAGPHYSQANLHWIECNGRWGGVSIPMTMLNRLFSDYRNRQFMVVQDHQESKSKLEFADTLSALNDMLYVHDRDEAGIILPIPRSADADAVSHYIAIGKTWNDVSTLADNVNRHMRERE